MNIPTTSHSPGLTDSPAREAMTGDERKATTFLSFLYGTRMLGLFLILPVFALHAQSLPGGKDAAAVGFALGIYGLTQGLLQIPFGMASDRFGRKRIIAIGMFIFGVGSVVAALAPDLFWVTIGRALQGAGAVSAAISALLADSTRDSQRTKAMAAIGSMIGLMFALSLVMAPLMYQWWGMSGLFYFIALLAFSGIFIVYLVPNVKPAGAGAVPAGGEPVSNAARDLKLVLKDADLHRLNLGIFVVNAVQMAMFVVIPLWLVDKAGMSLPEHWKIYLPAVLLSFVLMAPILFKAERGGKLKQAFLGSILLLLAVQIGLAFMPLGLVSMAILLLLFFVGFNVLEAALPSLVSKLAPAHAKGAALGVYNTVQALGLFVGASVGGWLVKQAGDQAVFWACAAALVVWFMVALGQQRYGKVPATA